LDRIGAYISEHDPNAAERVVGRIASLAGHLVDHPEMGRRGRIAGTRELIIPEFPYIVVYRLSPSSVDVLTVLHALRKWPDQF
jgi:plasmid stabilization system protein ParE